MPAFTHREPGVVGAVFDSKHVFAELICDGVETMLMAHQLDGLVLVPNCDKIVPGMVMAAVRMDVPAVVCSGGPMLAGTYGGEEVSLSKMFEAVGATRPV